MSYPLSHGSLGFHDPDPPALTRPDAQKSALTLHSLWLFVAATISRICVRRPYKLPFNIPARWSYQRGNNIANYGNISVSSQHPALWTASTLTVIPQNSECSKYLSSMD
ncbi:hypothetical protein Tco_1540185 [Tanacetum coccineum]